MYSFSTAPKHFDVKLLGRIDGCTNPESAELLPDGEHFIFGNCAMIVGHPGYRAGQGIVYLKGQAFISKARIAPSGDVSLVKRDYITGLTATLGLDLLRHGTAKFPAGTAFIAEGGNPITIPGDDKISNKATPRVLAFDPLNGTIIDEIPLYGTGALASEFNTADQPNGLAITDAAVYIGDIPNSNPVDALPPPVPSAIYRIANAGLDMAGSAAGATHIQRIVMPDWVNGLCASPNEDVIYAVSCSAHDSTGGSIYRLTAADFATGILPKPLISGIGLFIDGVACSKRGTLFVSTPINGQIHAFTPEGEHHIIVHNGANLVRMPADFNICYPKALGGEPALLVPDISVGFPPGDASVAVVDISGL